MTVEQKLKEFEKKWTGSRLKSLYGQDILMYDSNGVLRYIRVTMPDFNYSDAFNQIIFDRMLTTCPFLKKDIDSFTIIEMLKWKKNSMFRVNEFKANLGFFQLETI